MVKLVVDVFNLVEAIPGNKKKLHLSEEMTHVDYDYFDDIGVPLTTFLKEQKMLNLNGNNGDYVKPNFDAFRKQNPDLLRKLEPYYFERSRGRHSTGGSHAE